MSLCLQYCDEYLEYRIDLGLSINTTKVYVFDLSRYLKDVNVNINFAKNVSLSFTSFGCLDLLPLSLISCLLFGRTFL